jgi:hypothetical protein
VGGYEDSGFWGVSGFVCLFGSGCGCGREGRKVGYGREGLLPQCSH